MSARHSRVAVTLRFLAAASAHLLHAAAKQFPKFFPVFRRDVNTQAGRAIPQACAKTLSHGIVLLETLQGLETQVMPFPPPRWETFTPSFGRSSCLHKN
jgi:hypothetical protein